MAWRSSMYRKRHQSQVNKVCRIMNKSIAKDELWRGRFVIEQKASYFLPYGDGSGHHLVVVYQFRDKKTGRIKERWNEANSMCMWNGSKLFWEMNEFIVEDCHDDTWSDAKNNIYGDKTDYTLIP